MANTRFFTLEEANALIPEISKLVETQLQRRLSIENELTQLALMLGTFPETLEENPNDPPNVQQVKRDVLKKLHEFQIGWNDIENMGVVVKDIRTGLIDFYSRIDGKTIFLCWRYGEQAIEHFHDLESGFAGRKSIEGSLKQRLYN